MESDILPSSQGLQTSESPKTKEGNLKKSNKFIIILLVTIVASIVFGIFYMYRISYQQKKAAVDKNEALEDAITSLDRLRDISLNNQMNRYLAFYNKGNDVYALSDYEKENLLATNEEFMVAAPNGKIFVTQKNDLFFVRMTDNTFIPLAPGIRGAMWSNNSRYALFTIEQIEDDFNTDKPKPSLITLWDLDTKKAINIFEIPETYYLQTVFNDGNLLLRKSLNTNNFEDENVELFIMNARNLQISSIRKLRFSSMPEKLSPDDSMIAFSDGRNLNIYNLKSNQLNAYTNFALNQGRVDNVYWSPDGNYIAFQTFENITLGYRVGILRLDTKEVKYVDQSLISSTIEIENPNRYPEIITFEPIGWDENSQTIFIASEVLVGDDPDLDKTKIYRYWTYNIDNEDITYLPILEDIIYPYFVY